MHAGIMPIMTYGGFKRMTGFCKTYVPQDVLDTLESVKDNDEAVKKFGIDLGVKMCKYAAKSRSLPPCPKHACCTHNAARQSNVAGKHNAQYSAKIACSCFGASACSCQLAQYLQRTTPPAKLATVL